MSVSGIPFLAGKGTHTEMEVELWVKYMGPVWKKSVAEMKQALVNWHAAMQRGGLTPDGPDEMDRFVYGDTGSLAKGAAQCRSSSN